MDPTGGKVDPQMMQFVQEEQQRQAFTQTVHTLNDLCFDTCFTASRPPSKLDSSTQTCLTNCVNRFIDASSFMLQRMAGQQQGGGGGGFN